MSMRVAPMAESAAIDPWRLDASPEPVSLYQGQVMHARLRPLGHRFTYRVASILIDLDRLAAAGRQSRLFSIGRFNLFSFHENDHGAGCGPPLRAWVTTLLKDAGIDASRGTVLLLCYPRVLGYVFDPLSVYFFYDEGRRLAAILYEVRNTFGERHAYVAPLRSEEVSAAGIRQERDKQLHVSPFLGMGLRYKFRIRPPDTTVALRILECEGEHPILAATFHGVRRALTTRTLLRMFGAIPFQSVKIIGGIHWEALKLWWKGARYHARPKPPAAASIDGRMVERRGT